MGRGPRRDGRSWPSRFYRVSSSAAKVVDKSVMVTAGSAGFSVEASQGRPGRAGPNRDGTRRKMRPSGNRYRRLDCRPRKATLLAELKRPLRQNRQPRPLLFLFSPSIISFCFAPSGALSFGAAVPRRGVAGQRGADAAEDGQVLEDGTRVLCGGFQPNGSAVRGLRVG